MYGEKCKQTFTFFCKKKFFLLLLLYKHRVYSFIGALLNQPLMIITMICLELFLAWAAFRRK